MLKNARDGLCVLTFHKISERCERYHDLCWETFIELLNRIEEKKLPVTTGLDLQTGKRAVALTFDDGTEDHLKVGEELAARNLSGLFFVSTGFFGKKGYLDEVAVKHLCSLGHTIGSHTVTHANLAESEPSVVLEELTRSKNELEDLLGERVQFFAPPGGIRPTGAKGDRYFSQLEGMGYLAARSMRWGVYRQEKDRWEIPCVPVLELSMNRGWPEQILDTFTLPLDMRLVGLSKKLVPDRLKNRLLSRGSR